jgi:membrane-associated phospholipid phosphatase
VLAAGAAATFALITVLVTTSTPLGIDQTAFRVLHDIRAPWLDHAARIVTTFGLFAVVGPSVLVAALLLVRGRERIRAAALAAGCGLAWLSVQIVKGAVDRARPPSPLVHATGSSYPSGHASNSVGWLALAIAVTVLVPRRFRLAAVGAGLLMMLAVGFTRVYLRAHYLSDVLGGESLALAVYAVTALVALGAARARARRARTRQAPRQPRPRRPLAGRRGT